MGGELEDPGLALPFLNRASQYQEMWRVGTTRKYSYGGSLSYRMTRQLLREPVI